MAFYNNYTELLQLQIADFEVDESLTDCFIEDEAEIEIKPKFDVQGSYSGVDIETQEDIENCTRTPTHHWADLEVVAEPDDEGDSQINSETNRSVLQNQINCRSYCYQCKLCVYQAQRAEVLLNHMSRKHTIIVDGFHICEFCGLGKTCEKSLKQHLREHVSNKKVCDDSWKWKEEENCNSPNYRPSTKWPSYWYRCKLCVYQSQTVKVLLNHMSRKHTIVDGSYYRCGFCGLTMSYEESLKQHLQDHAPKKKVFDDSWKWKVRLEEDENNYYKKKKRLSYKKRQHK